MTSALRILPAYTGIDSVDKAFDDPRATRVLWLEILVNDQIDFSPWQDNPVFQEAYYKACCWYTAYRSVVDSLLARQPLPRAQGTLDQREHRTFLEAIRFAATHP